VRRATILAAAVALSAAACGGAAKPAAYGLTDADRIRESAAVRDSEKIAPEQFAEAERERGLSRQAHDRGDETASQLHAERAIAAYEHAVVLARLSRATRESADAKTALDTATDEAQKAHAQLEESEREAESLEKQVKVAREMLLPAPSGPTDPARAAARLVAAKSLAMQARLLCGAAKLVSPDATGLGDAEQDLAALDKRLETGAKGQAEPIDEAARARATCLALLNKARRASDASSTGAADTLLAELSASGGWDPSRDERGVVVTLREAFKGTTLTQEAETKLKELGRIAGAHPTFGVQIVVHDAAAPSAAEEKADAQRADAAVKAIVAGGAPSAKVRGETAGARSPIVDPSDAAHRARNARVEIVFVAPSN
jgi:flagellar motor protein MotB